MGADNHPTVDMSTDTANKKTVYVVTQYTFTETRVVGVYENRATAEAVADNNQFRRVHSRTLQ